jgi:hypothetical protein
MVFRTHKLSFSFEKMVPRVGYTAIYNDPDGKYLIFGNLKNRNWTSFEVIPTVYVANVADIGESWTLRTNFTSNFGPTHNMSQKLTYAYNEDLSFKFRMVRHNPPNSPLKNFPLKISL